MTFFSALLVLQNNSDKSVDLMNIDSSLSTESDGKFQDVLPWGNRKWTSKA